MNPEQEIFEAAAALRAGERSAYLDTVCAGRPELHVRVEALLRSHDATEFMASGAAESHGPRFAGESVSLEREKSGERIGRYRLLQQIGEGGFGTVWVAEQLEPVRRRVALKIIKLGMDTREVIARFDQERQALAMMDHPGIARVFDAGATKTGRPYFVMELVRGMKITDYCDEQELSPGARIRLFITVCLAVQHAHQKGVIHRDLKPSNILVTVNDGEAVPKVIDFGVAKATQGRLTDNTVYTQFEQMVGTPIYMSPEQAGLTSLDVDTRSDIYSLGVLLYELLTGSTPIEQDTLRRVAIDEVRRLIREVDPPRPSLRVKTLPGERRTTTAKQRRTEADKLPVLLRGDLDWIVMKALDKNRTRRYETANALAMDLRRFLADEPVIAASPSAIYRVRKFVRRHKTAFFVSVAILGILNAATVVSAWLAFRAIRAEELASTRRKEAEGAFSFLTELFQSPDPGRDGRTITFAETLDCAAKKLETNPGVPPERRAKMQATIGWTYQTLGLYQEAIPLLEKACHFYVTANGENHPETVLAMHNLAWSLFRNGREEEALKLRDKVLPRARDVLGPQHQNLLSMMDMLVSPQFAAESDQKKALRLLDKLQRASSSGLENQETLMAMGELALFYNESGNFAESLPLWERVVPLCRKLNGAGSYMTFWAMQGMADAIASNGRVDEAIKLEEDIVALRKTNLGADHLDTLMGMDNLADSLAAAGRRAEAIKLDEEALALCQNRYGRDAAQNFNIKSNLADFHADSGRLREALALREDILDYHTGKNQPRSRGTLDATAALAGTLTLLGEFDRAGELLGRVLPEYKNSGRAADYEIRLKEMAELRFRQKRFEEAEAYCEERIQSRRGRSGAEHSATILDANLDLGRLLSEWAWSERNSGTGAPRERAARAVALLSEAPGAEIRNKTVMSRRRPDILSRLGWAQFVAGFTDSGQTPAAGDTAVSNAEKLMAEGLLGMEREPATKHGLKRDGYARLIRFFETRAQPEKATNWKNKLAASEANVLNQEPPASAPQ